MVESNEEVTITTDRSKIIAFYILQRQYDVVQEIKEYERVKAMNPRGVRFFDLRANIIALWFQVRANIRYADKDLYVEIDELFVKNTLVSVLDAFDLIDEFLCEANLSRFIFKRDYDTSSPVDEDEAKGL